MISSSSTTSTEPFLAINQKHRHSACYAGMRSGFRYKREIITEKNCKKLMIIERKDFANYNAAACRRARGSLVGSGRRKGVPSPGGLETRICPECSCPKP